jgi:hypothetical protein
MNNQNIQFIFFMKIIGIIPHFVIFCFSDFCFELTNLSYLNYYDCFKHSIHLLSYYLIHSVNFHLRTLLKYLLDFTQSLILSIFYHYSPHTISHHHHYIDYCYHCFLNLQNFKLIFRISC